MSIFREEIYQLTKKNILDLQDKSKLKVLSRFSLEHFYHYRFTDLVLELENLVHLQHLTHFYQTISLQK